LTFSRGAGAGLIGDLDRADRRRLEWEIQCATHLFSLDLDVGQMLHMCSISTQTNCGGRRNGKLHKFLVAHF
jgi:hypothetical protein